MHVEIWSDVVCPWCYLGKHRFAAALDRFAHKDDVTVTWRAFQLDPSVPRGASEPTGPWLQRKLGVSEARLRQMHDHLEALARGAGITMDLGATRVAHTIDAHRALRFAAAAGVGEPAVERLFRAQFAEGRALGERDTLVDVLGEVGVDREALRRALDGDAHHAEVEAEIDEARALGIRGVPCFVFDRDSAVSGAQEPAVLLEALDRAWRQRS